MKPARTFKTEKGTELPLLDLRGKDYLQVAHRLVWFREQHPDWSIETQIISFSENGALVKATIKNDKGITIATSHKTEDRKGFQDFIEKAETGAIGRALAACGFGTQFAPELDEGERLADSPVQRPQTPKPPPSIHEGPSSIELSEKQLIRLRAIAGANGWSDNEIKGYLSKIGLTSTKQLNRLQYDKLCETMEKFPFKKREVTNVSPVS